MPDNSLIRRAQEARERFNERLKEDEEAHEAFMKYMDERDAKIDELIEGLAESKDVEALQEYLRTGQEEIARRFEAAAARAQEARSAVKEVELIELEANLEGTRLRFDVVKQQATFSAAAVAGVIAITVNVLPEDLELVWMLWGTIGILLATIAVSLLLLYIESFNIQGVLERGTRMPEGARARRITELFYLSALGLPTAIVVFLVFAIVNLV